MKAEDAVRLFNEVRAEFERRFPGAAVLQLTGLTAAFQTAFARACEQHGINRAKAGVRSSCERCAGLGYVLPSWHCHRCGGTGTHEASRLNWSALDDEVAKENEDG